MDETQRILEARKRLLLQSERAFGVDAVTWTESASEVAEVEEVGDAPRKPKPRAPAAEPTRAEPVVDLFGKVTKPAKQGAAPPSDPLPGELLPLPKRIERLRVLDHDEVRGCEKCPLHETRTQTVFGDGSPDARLMFIGEGPGENEDQQGKPFVGRAGQLLDKMIGAMGLSRESVYIANIVKCRPPQNRNPAAEEIEACTPYLNEQIGLVRPEAIVTLGLPASRYMLNSNLSMGKLRGQWHDWRGIKLMPTY
ncbi:MAG: uracil-DNA glycosylase, partial [Planctomycetota bacterium]